MPHTVRGAEDMNRIQTVAWLALASPLLVWCPSEPAGVPVQMMISVGHDYGHSLPMLTEKDLTVTQAFEPLPITSLTPLQAERGGLELFLLVDNCSSCEPGNKFEELRHFIGSQSSTTSIGIAYIQDGRLKIAERPTQNREKALAALSAPTGGAPASPFVSLAELIKGWDANRSRHVVLMISNGIDPSAVEPGEEPSAEAAIKAAQRARVPVYAIYHPSADYATADSSRIYSGQIQLAHVAIETGGEAYFLGFGPLPSLAPFLADIADHLASQYLLEFIANPGATGSLQEITVKSKLPGIDLMAPDRAWIPARPSTSPNPGKRQ
jgi:hypothetical protein